MRVARVRASRPGACLHHVQVDEPAPCRHACTLGAPGVEHLAGPLDGTPVKAGAVEVEAVQMRRVSNVVVQRLDVPAPATNKSLDDLG